MNPTTTAETARLELEADEISLLALGTLLLRNRWRIVRWMFIGGAISALLVFTRPVTYDASASFVPVGGSDQNRSGIANLAGQLGVSIPQTNQSLSPDFYSKLLESRVLLLPIARDTFAVQEMGGKRIPFLDLFEIPEGARREEQALKVLQKMLSVSMVKTTGVVNFSISTRWRSISVAIASALLDGVNEYNQRTRQGQAAAERKFVEGRLDLARGELRAAEDRLQQFLATNRNIGGSPELSLDRDRLQRDVTLRQQVFTSLTQAYEDARIREVRDTPVITIFEPPWAPAEPQSGGRLKRVLLGLVLGGFIGAVLAFASEMTVRRGKEGDAEASEFVGALHEVKGELLGPVRRLRARIRQ